MSRLNSLVVRHSNTLRILGVVVTLVALALSGLAGDPGPC
jgi:hypothetical protein